MNITDILTSVCQQRDVRSARVSSWDHTGGNRDYFVVLPGETAVLADIAGYQTYLGDAIMQGTRWAESGAGSIEQAGCIGQHCYRKIVIRMYWDGQDQPSVLAPFGDFFCIGNSITGNFQSLPFTVSAWPAQRNRYGGDAAVNCYLTMPFNQRARIEIENQADQPLTQYFYVDYELYRQQLAPDTLYFHAHWRRENPTKGWAPPLMQVNQSETEVPNLDGKDNFVILDTQGAGNYIGCNMSITKLQPGWWGEGDDMIWRTMAPVFAWNRLGRLLNQAWEMQPGNAYNFCGSIVHETDVPDNQVSYRFHLVDPVRFAKSIRVTIEHGHGNHLSNDCATTAYWYQTLPGPKLAIPPVEGRLPTRPRPIERKSLQRPEPSTDSLKARMIKEAEGRFEAVKKDRQENSIRLARQSEQWASQNTENARVVREKWLQTARADRE